MNGNWELDFHVFFWQIDRYYTCDMNMADSFILWVFFGFGKDKSQSWIEREPLGLLHK
jgi:hypothetical protein